MLLAVILAFGALLPAQADPGARVIKYSRDDIVTVHAKVRFSTLIILPPSEEIIDFTTGDKDFWIINGVHNLCFLHPAQVGSRTNLNLVTASGHVYSFLLTEVSSQPDVQPDLKIFIEPKEQSTIGGAILNNYVPAAEAAAYRKQVETVREQAESQVMQAQSRATQEIEQFRHDYPQKLRFDYQWNQHAADDPFLVSMIFHDDRFTYIHCAAKEKPAVYETKDGKPSLINFEVEDSVYVIPKIVDSGYLVIGKRKATFTRHE